MGIIDSVKKAVFPRYEESWAKPFERWFKTSHVDGQARWRDKAFDPEYVAQQKRAFRAGWRAAVTEARRRVREENLQRGR